MNQTLWRAVRVGMVLAGLMIVSGMIGCTTKLKLGRYDLVVTPDASLRDSGSGKLPLVEVDLIGVSENEIGTWTAQSVDQHFSGENARRAAAKEYTRTFTFSQDDAGAKTLASNDPIYQAWEKRGVTALFVFASARTFRVSPGGPDGRRLSIPMTTDKWEVRKIDLVLKSGGVECATAMKVVK